MNANLPLSDIRSLLERLDEPVDASKLLSELRAEIELLIVRHAFEPRAES